MDKHTIYHSKFGKGIINNIQQDGCKVNLTVVFSCGEKLIEYSPRFKHLFQFDDHNVQEELDKAIQLAEEEAQRIEEEKRKQQEESRRQAQVAQHRGHSETREVSFERTTEDKMYFLVFQNHTFDIESTSNYLWAPKADARGSWPHHWERLRQVRKGDVIFHCKDQAIRAISVAQGEAYSCVQPNNSVYGANWDRDGLKLDTDVNVLGVALPLSECKSQIVAAYPSGSSYAPFDKNGDGNQGYLFELAPNLAKLFLSEIVKRNSLPVKID